MRSILLLFVALFASSCVRPSCASWAYSSPRTDREQREHFATIQVYSKPIKDPAKRYSTGLRLRGQFEQGASFTIDSTGRMKVTRLDVWPRHCPTISPASFGQLSREVQPVLDRLPRRQNVWRAMKNQYRGGDEWQPDGPLVHVTFGTPFGPTLQLLWDGRTRLPEDVENAVLKTLDAGCANSGLARKYLLRDLPPEVSSRLKCR